MIYSCSFILWTRKATPKLREGATPAACSGTAGTRAALQPLALSVRGVQRAWQGLSEASLEGHSSSCSAGLPLLPPSLSAQRWRDQQAFQWSIAPRLGKQGAGSQGSFSLTFVSKIEFSLLKGSLHFQSVPFLPPFCSAQPSHRPRQKKKN